MRLNHIAASLFLVMAPITAASAAMTAQTFYTKAVALEKKGMAAMFSKELKPMMSEMKSASAAVKAENELAKKKGSALYCPPKKAGMDSKQVIAAFGAIPESRRKTMTVQSAWREIAIKKFPC